MVRPLFPLLGFMPTTPVLPKLYWEAITPEQELHELCKRLHMLFDYAGKLGTLTAEQAEQIRQLAAEFEKFVNSGFEDYYERLLSEWLNVNMGQIFSMYAKLVIFGLDADGHFAAWIPESWSEIYFSMVADYSDVLYGRLVLLYDAEGNFDYQYGAPTEVGNYENLSFKPAIEGHVLMGNQTFEQLGLIPMTEQEIEDA